VQNTVYLAGTCHVVAEDEIPFPSPFYAAYRDSQEIYVEFDTLSLWSRVRAIRVLPKMIKWIRSHGAELKCPKGRTLRDYLSTGTVERLEAFYGKDYRKHERMTPLGLVFWNDLALEEGGDDGGVDDLFTLLAYKDGKPIRTLDDKAVLDFAVPILDEMLSSFRRDIARRGADAVVEEHILSEQNEREDAAIERELTEMKSEVPALYEKLLPERNRKWLPKLKFALQGKNNVMVLVGAMHLGGEEGLLQILQEAGFSPEQMYGMDRPEPSDPALKPARRGAPLTDRNVTDSSNLNLPASSRH
jgi:hypothetical protein